MMLVKGNSVNYVFDGETPLHVAVRCNKLDAVKALMNHNGDINCVNRSNETPILVSIESETDTPEMLQLLSQYRPDLNIRSIGGMTPLLLAASMGRTDTVRYLLELGADKDTVDSQLRSSLSIASTYGYEEICHELIQRGCDVSRKDRWGLTPLHYACELGRLNIVELLLTAGCDFNTEDVEGSTPLLSAFSLYFCNSGVVEILLKYGANANCCDTRGFTPLSFAIRNDIKGKHLSLVRLLLENGASPNIVNSSHFSPLLYAASHDNVDLFSLLVSYGADVNFLYNEDTPLSILIDQNEPFPSNNQIILNAIKWKALGLIRIPEKTITCIHVDALSAFQKYEEHCLYELNLIKNFNSKLFLVLTKCINDVTYHVKNQSLLNFILSDECVNKFPLYQSIMSLRWRRAQVRFILLQDCQNFIKWLENFIPYCCVDLILCYICDKDLKTLSYW